MKLILVRHGESVWNKENRFTGWVDVDLSETGIKEAERAGQLLAEEGLTPGVAHTSRLKRAIRTLNIILSVMDLDWIDIKKTWRLNERHYGALQGLNKTETAEKHGEEQVKIWRRSYSTPPPFLSSDDSHHPKNDTRYSGDDSKELPSGESLAMTVERLMPYWESAIKPDLKKYKTVMVAAHGNSLRALVKELDQMSEAEILELNIPTAVPIVYELDDNFKVINKKYLGDAASIAAAQAAVANQGKSQK